MPPPTRQPAAIVADLIVWLVTASNGQLHPNPHDRQRRPAGPLQNVSCTDIVSVGTFAVANHGLMAWP